MDSQTAARRQAQRFLAEHVRNDWDWPPPTQTTAAEQAADAAGLLHGVAECRERFYSTTSSEPDTDGEKQADANNPYKFDSPDSVAVAVETTRAKRKRKRRRRMEDEMAWNDGLRCFVLRRDVWTGADAVKKWSASARGGAPPRQSDHAVTLSPSAAEELHLSSKNGLEKKPTQQSAVGDRDGLQSNQANASAHPSVDGETLVPVAAPLLPPSNSLRAVVGPKTYPEIYNRVVLSSRTPSIPINLADMTRALVQGWKDNGEWPPKTGPLDPLIGRRKAENKTIKHAMGFGDGPQETSFLAQHPHVKRGVESVKKVFRLSGSHSSSHHGTPSGEAG